MLEVMLQMGALVACGAAWRVLVRGELAAEPMRRALSGLVYYLLLPALVLSVLWRAPVGAASLGIAAAAAAAVAAGMALGWASCRLCRMPRPVTGAVILAAAFPNATYLGLPVLEASLGPWARGVAIQYDLFACTPLLLTAGMAIAAAHGDTGTPVRRSAVLRVPALWAALAAVALNRGGVVPPELLVGVLSRLADGVVPLMLLVLGMSLRWEALAGARVRVALPVAVIQLVIMPALTLALLPLLGLDRPTGVAVVLEAAMPSMVLGVVICDRFGLDTAVYAAAATLTTLGSLLSLPLWYEALAAARLAAPG